MSRQCHKRTSNCILLSHVRTYVCSCVHCGTCTASSLYYRRSTAHHCLPCHNPLQCRNGNGSCPIQILIEHPHTNDCGFSCNPTAPRHQYARNCCSMTILISVGGWAVHKVPALQTTIQQRHRVINMALVCMHAL